MTAMRQKITYGKDRWKHIRGGEGRMIEIVIEVVSEVVDFFLDLWLNKVVK